MRKIEARQSLEKSRSSIALDRQNGRSADLKVSIVEDAAVYLSPQDGRLIRVMRSPQTVGLYILTTIRI